MHGRSTIAMKESGVAMLPFQFKWTTALTLFALVMFLCHDSGQRGIAWGDETKESAETLTERKAAGEQVSGKGAHGGPLPRVLDTTQAIHEADSKAEGKEWPVDLTATLLLYDMKRGYCFVQQDDVAVYVQFADGAWPEFKNIHPGDLVHIDGVLADFYGAVTARSMAIVGKGELPAPVVEPLANLELGSHWGRWTVQEGTVKQVARLKNATYLGLEMEGVYFSARIPHPIPTLRAKELVGSRVRLSGALACENGKGELERFIIYLMSTDNLEVIEPGPPWMDFKPITLDALDDCRGQLVRFEGVIAHVNRYRRVLVEQGLSSATVIQPLTEWLYRQEVVEVYGRYVGNETVEAVLLVETLKSELGPGNRMTPQEFVESGVPMRRVLMSGTVRRTKSKGNIRRVYMTDDDVDFYVEFESDEKTFVDLNLNDALRVQFHGCAMRLPAYADGEQFRVLVPFGETVKVQSLKSEAVRKRVLTTIVGIAMVTLVLLSLLGILRYQVKTRTSELARETARLEASCNAVREGILMVEGIGEPSICNEQFLKLFDLSAAPGSLEELLDQVAGQIKLADEFRTWCRSFSGSHDASGSREFSTKGKNPRWLHVYTAAVHPDRPASKGFSTARIWTFDDITERRVLEIQLRESHKMEAVGQLAGGVAHDFNNILATILTNFDLMRLQPDRTATDFMEEIAVSEQAIAHATELIRSLLEYSRDTRLDTVALDVNQLIAVTDRFIRASVGAGIELQIIPDPSTKPVRADRTRLQQVLVNLCLNARDATDGKGTIRIETASFSDGSAEFVEIRVSDDGCGIHPEQLNRIFDPFYTTKGPGLGTGLGLAMVYGIITKHGGTITASSTLGEGTEFTIHLPATNEQPVNLSQLDRFPVSSAGSKGRQRAALPLIDSAEPAATRKPAARILLADDENGLRRAVSIMLKSAGFSVDEAKDGAEALEMLRKPNTVYDLVLLDLLMPRVNGIEALKRIRDSHPDLPVIMFSGRISAEQFENESHRPNAIFSKPIQSAVLIEAIHQAMGNAYLPDVGIAAS